MARAFVVPLPPSLSPAPFLCALSSVGWHRVGLSIPNTSEVVPGCWCQGVKAHPHGTGLGGSARHGAFDGFCRVFGVLLVGETGLFQGGVVL